MGISSFLTSCSQTPSTIEQHSTEESVQTISVDSAIVLCTHGDTIRLDSIDLSTCTSSERRVIEQIQIVEDMNHKYDEMKVILDSMVIQNDGGYDK